MKKPRLRYFPCTDMADAMDAARCVGGSILCIDGQWRCYSQINRLYLDFPELKAPLALVKEQIRHLRQAGLTDEQIISFMSNWHEPTDGSVVGASTKFVTTNPLRKAGVEAILQEIR